MIPRPGIDERILLLADLVGRGAEVFLEGFVVVVEGGVDGAGSAVVFVFGGVGHELLVGVFGLGRIEGLVFAEVGGEAVPAPACIASWLVGAQDGKVWRD